MHSVSEERRKSTNVIKTLPHLFRENKVARKPNPPTELLVTFLEITALLSSSAIYQAKKLVSKCEHWGKFVSFLELI